MHIENISYDVDGTTHIGTLAYDDTVEGTRPAVLVCHEGPGITDVTREKAKRLAEAGYIAFALDYHGGGQMLPDRTAMMTRLGALIGDADTTTALGFAGLGVLLSQPQVDHSRVAAIGYCFGGTMVLQMARAGAELAAVVGFHSGLGTSRPAEPGAITAKVLTCIGADDPMIPVEQRSAFEQEMRNAGADWQMNVYGGAQHSFTNPLASSLGMPGIEYHESTDVRSWAAMLDLFGEVFGS